VADEATITSQLVIRKGHITYQSQPAGFTADVDGTNGPTPGAVTATVAGTVVSLAQLDNPGLCRVMNIDATNFVTVGVDDGLRFFPLMELLPGESYVFRLSRYLNEEFTDTGTGTNSDVNYLMVKADTASCVVVVEAFES
jgi:hypothetical protein